MNSQLEQQIKAVLNQTIQVLLPDVVDPDALTAQHVWRDSNYVGTHNGKVAVWRGWRIRLPIQEAKDNILYIDVADNVLPLTERQRLFGAEFAQAVSDLAAFVVMYTTRFPLNTHADIVEHGFTPRELSRALHACTIMDADIFLQKPVAELTETAVSLLRLQRSFAKP